MNITIRRAEDEDFASILELIREFSHFQKSADKVTITLEQMYEEREFFQCLVAETPAGQLVGFASFFFAYYSWTGKALYLDDLYVQESYRKRGVGRELLESVLELARQHNCKKVRWQVSNWNRNAIDFYTRMGASIDEVEINCDYTLKAVPCELQ